MSTSTARKPRVKAGSPDALFADPPAPAIGKPGWRPDAVHPVADLFPMMTDDELTELAADIKENGLLHPIVVDTEGMLIDGRNRLRACEIAEIEPDFEVLHGEDPTAFIVSANLARRNLSKGQQAMALAMIYPEGKRGVKDLNISRSEQVLLSQARAILRHSVELAQDVLHRGTHFDVASKQVQGEMQKRKAHDAQMAQLHTHAPDVAAMVTDGRLTVDEGIRQLGTLQTAVRHRAEAGLAAAERLADLSGHVLVIESALRLTDAELAMIGRERATLDPLAALTRQDLVALVDAVDRLIEWHDGTAAEDQP